MASTARIQDEDSTGPQRASFAAKEIAARHGLSLSFVYEEIARGALKAVKPGGHGPYRITIDAEEEWLRGGAR